MRRIFAAIGGTVFGSLLLVATVAAADPTPSPSAAPTASTGTVATVLGLTQAQVQDLRHDGLSLAQIATQQKVEVQKVIDALVARWQERITARVASDALTEAEAAKLRTQLLSEAQAMVSRTTLGGMQGAVVGAGPRNGAGNGTGTCDGTGSHGAGRP